MVISSGRRKHNLHVYEGEDPDTFKPDIQEETFDEFLRDMHGVSKVELSQSQPSTDQAETIKEEPEKMVQAGDNRVPSLKYLRTHFRTRSGMIRYMASIGIERKVIAKHLNIKYQHVRNVLTTTLKRGPNEDFEIDGTSTISSTSSEDQSDSRDVRSEEGD